MKFLLEAGENEKKIVNNNRKHWGIKMTKQELITRANSLYSYCKNVGVRAGMNPAAFDFMPVEVLKHQIKKMEEMTQDKLKTSGQFTGQLNIEF